MALLEIYTYPEEVLRQVAKPVGTPDEEIRRLVEDMKETMYEAPGVGLAAPQIGRSIRLVVIDPSGGEEEGQFMAIVDPVISEGEGTIVCEEGCLSVPGAFAEVKRHERIRLTGMTPEGEPIDQIMEGFPAVVVQHEVDHLDGKLFVDHLSGLKRKMILKRLVKGTAMPPHRAESAI